MTEQDFLYRVTWDTMPGGMHEREPSWVEYPTFHEALYEFDRLANHHNYPAPFEVTLYRRESGKIGPGKMMRRITVYEEDM